MIIKINNEVNFSKGTLKRDLSALGIKAEYVKSGTHDVYITSPNQINSEFIKECITIVVSSERNVGKNLRLIEMGVDVIHMEDNTENSLAHKITYLLKRPTKGTRKRLEDTRMKIFGLNRISTLDSKSITIESNLMEYNQHLKWNTNILNSFKNIPIELQESYDTSGSFSKKYSFEMSFPQGDNVLSFNREKIITSNEVNKFLKEEKNSQRLDFRTLVINKKQRNFDDLKGEVIESSIVNESTLKEEYDLIIYCGDNSSTLNKNIIWKLKELQKKPIICFNTDGINCEQVIYEREDFSISLTNNIIEEISEKEKKGFLFHKGESKAWLLLEDSIKVKEIYLYGFSFTSNFQYDMKAQFYVKNPAKGFFKINKSYRLPTGEYYYHAYFHGITQEERELFMKYFYKHLKVS